MGKWQYLKGVHDLGDGLYAYLQPSGTWGWSNAGLIAGEEGSLLVDTLFDLRLTSEMLATLRRATPAADQIKTVVNTHANGDHCYGNAALLDVERIASSRAAEEMREMPPGKMAALMRLSRWMSNHPAIPKAVAGAASAIGLEGPAQLLRAAPFVNRIFGDFSFDNIPFAPPTRTFERQLTLTVGSKTIELLEVGPAHTRGDVIVSIPGSRAVFTGDVLFVGGHPVLWEGPVSNWVAACERIIELQPEVVVPGHGPICDLDAVRGLKEYLELLTREARARFDAQMGEDAAALEIARLTDSSLMDSERLAVNIRTLYREFRGETRRPTPFALFDAMARFETRVVR